MQWWNLKYSELVNSKVILIISLSVFILFSLFKTKSAVFECAGEYKYCTVTSKNAIGFKSTKTVRMPGDIVNTYIEKYQKRNVGRRHHSSRSKYRYNLFVLDKNGEKIKLFGGIYVESYAKRLGKEILSCVEGKTFPCQVKY